MAFFPSCCATFTLPGCVLMHDFEKVPIVLRIHQFAKNLTLELLSRIPLAKYYEA